MDLELTPEQAKLFNKLKAAYKACEKGGIYFANYYGSLQAYDKAIVEGYGDDRNYSEDDEDVLLAAYHQPSHSMTIPNEWCDDEGGHFIKLTRKGMKLKQSEES